MDHNKLWKILKKWAYQTPDLPLELSLGERRGVGVDMELKSPSEACLCASPLNAVFLRVLTSVLFNLTHSFTPLDYFCFDHCQVHFQSIHLSASSDCLIEVQAGDVQH